MSLFYPFLPHVGSPPPRTPPPPPPQPIHVHTFFSFGEKRVSPLTPFGENPGIYPQKRVSIPGGIVVQGCFGANGGYFWGFWGVLGVFFLIFAVFAVFN